jgi:exodeoxyribonuclease V
MSDVRLTPSDLSEDQRAVYDAMLAWWTDAKPGGILRVAGFAGTGKSSLLGVFAAALDGGPLVAYVTVTGRASSVLGRKLKAAGAELTTLQKPPENARKIDERFYDESLPSRGGPAFCGTLHRLLYRPVIDAREQLKGFEKRVKLDREYRLIALDEASMASQEMLADLQVHGVPILLVGDHGQLPPVRAAGGLVDKPDFKLEKIHRQAVGNPIIRLAHSVRKYGELREKYADGERVVFRRARDVEDVLAEVAAEFDGRCPKPGDFGLLCYTNKTRVRLNGLAREAFGFQGVPRAGELVIALRNRPPVYNGMRGVLAEDAVMHTRKRRKLKPQLGLPGVLDEAPRLAPWEMRARIGFPDEGLPPERHTLCAAQFNRERVFEDVDALRERGIDVQTMGMAGEFYDFGYCLTTHRAQGSQFKHAIVMCERMMSPTHEEWRRWMYTSVTRASARLTILR